MAVQTQPYFSLSGSHGTFSCDIEYEDTDYNEINDDGDPDDYRILRFYGQNDMDIPVVVGFRRGNGVNWTERTIPAGDPFSQDTGGPVKYESDVPQHYVRPQG